MALSNEQFDAYREQIAGEAVTGVDTVTVDGETVKLADIMKRLDAVDRVQARAAAPRAHRGIFFSQFVPPGGGGS